MLREPAVAARISLDNDGSLSRTYCVLVSDDQQALLREYLASFTRLEMLVEDSVWAPATAEDYQMALPQFPRMRIAVTEPSYAAGDAWFACDFRVGVLLDDLVSEARTRGADLSYQINVDTLRPRPEWLRDARKNELRLAQVPGLPPDVRALQSRLIDGLRAASAICEEYVGTSERDSEWLRGALLRAFDRLYGQAHFDSPQFAVVENGYDEAISCAVHSARVRGTLTIEEIVGEAIDERSAGTLLAWRPDASTLAQLTNVSRTTSRNDAFNVGEESPVPRGVLPSPYEGDDRYLFLSYKHHDAARIGPVLTTILNLGYNVWYDAGIPGGSEWDAVIEDRLNNADAVLMFLTRDAVLSKYVRREVKYADMIGKPILTIKLEDTELSQGLQMLLTHYQMVDGSLSRESLEAIERALRYLRGVTS